MPAAADDDYTPREIGRSLRRLEQAITDLRQEVSTLGFVRQDVWSVERDAMHERIETVRAVIEADVADLRRDHENTRENLRWLARLVAGAVVTAVIAAMFASGIGP